MFEYLYWLFQPNTREKWEYFRNRREMKGVKSDCKEKRRIENEVGSTFKHNLNRAIINGDCRFCFKIVCRRSINYSSKEIIGSEMRKIQNNYDIVYGYTVDKSDDINTYYVGVLLS